MVGAAIAGVLSSVAQEGIRYGFDKMQAQNNFALAEKAADNQFKRQLDVAKYENWYNSPEQQVLRRLAGGLSPSENVDSGNMSGLSSVPGNQFAQTGAYKYTPNLDILQVLRNVHEVRNLGKTGNKMDQDLSNAIIEGSLKQVEKQLKEAGLTEMAAKINALLLDNERKKRENNSLYTDNYYGNLLLKMIADRKNSEKNLELFPYNKQIAEANAKMLGLQSKQFEELGINPSQLGPLELIILSIINNGIQMSGNGSLGDLLTAFAK